MKRGICYKTVKIVHPSKHKTLYTICTMLDQRRRRWADVVQMLYKWRETVQCIVLVTFISPLVPIV